MDIKLLFSTMGLLFMMELGDKTQLAVLSLTARTGRVLPIFVGATLALTVVTLLGVAAGALAGEFIPIEWLSRLAGFAFLAIGAFMLWSSRRGPSENGEEEETSEKPARARNPFGVLAVSFGLLFAAEMGDKSQLSVVSMTVKTDNPLSVFLGASLGLALVTLLGVLAGKAVTRIVPVHWVSRGAALIFIVIGLLTLTGIF